MFPTNNFLTEPLVESSVVVMREVNQTYLEILIETRLVQFKILDGHSGSRVFAIAHFRETAAVLNTSDV